MQKYNRKVPDSSPQASKKYIFVHQISIFLKKTMKPTNNIGEKNREKKYKIIIFAKTLKNEGFGADFFLAMGQNFGHNPPPPLFRNTRKQGGGFVARIRSDYQRAATVTRKLNHCFIRKHGNCF